jgi:cytochrome c553
MNKYIAVAALTALIVPVARADLEWAYQSVDKNAPSLGIDQDAPRTVPGSSKTYTQKQIDDSFDPPDWFPDRHPPMPEIVAHGDAPDVQACSACHLTSGMGHPESGQLAGLQVDYFLEQIADFRSGVRKDRFWMNRFAAGLSDEQAQAAAEYYSGLKPIKWVKVVEADTVPKTFIGDGRMRFRYPDGGTEPIGNRIIELPQDRALVTAAAPDAGFIAYVPTGSLAKGEDLVTTGASGKTIQCTICHGQDLQGLGEVPRIAGLSPVYIVRQLNDFQSGARAGASAALMQAPVAQLTEEDIVALAAYLASLPPQ